MPNQGKIVATGIFSRKSTGRNSAAHGNCTARGRYRRRARLPENADIAFNFFTRTGELVGIV
jgi:hypothetical protein